MIGSLPRMSPITIGEMQVHALVDAVSAARRPADMMLDLDARAVAANAGWLEPHYIDPDTGFMIIAYTSYLIRIAGQVILVDCAVGEDGEFPARPDWHHAKSDWLNHLGLAGATPQDIDTVFLTHLHVDHTGWLTRKTAAGWVPSFPGARHLASAAELAYWPEHHADHAFMAASVPDAVAPVMAAGLFQTVQPETELAPGVFVTDLAGHSPGMIGLEYRQDDRVLAAFTADLMHHPIQMADPGASTMFCTDPEQAARCRRDKLVRYAKDETLMFCNHFPGNSAGYAVPQGQGMRFLPAGDR